jgi:hypothetical protein
MRLFRPLSYLAPYSHSIVRIGSNELIYRCKNFSALKTPVAPNRQMRMAFEFKEKFDRSRKSPLSATINIDRSTFLECTGDAAIDRDVAWSDRSSASDRIMASVAGDLLRISRAI